MNYAGIEDEYAQLESAETVLIPVPYDGTSTWIKGADKGPEAFLDASANMELYDIETKSEPYKNGVFLADPVSENSSPEAMTESVYQTTKSYLEKDKLVTLFGGEHSISIGAIRAFYEKFEDLTVIQIDAHSDLRQEYHGSKCNHACALAEAQKHTNLIQIGIRSMDTEELPYLDKKKVFFAHDICNRNNWVKDVLKLTTKNVYITIDLDAFDPSIMPSTGTPEPGGLTWYQVMKLLKRIFKRTNVVGWDINELCPNPNAKASDFLAAKLYYRMLAEYFHHKKNKE
jgi:agmatinase